MTAELVGWTFASSLSTASDSALVLSSFASRATKDIDLLARLWVISRDELIAVKALAARPQDIGDIEKLRDLDR